jgi:serine/threonine-protein kinase
VPLSIGSRLGAYEVVALLGAGGMGEVYRARDTKLNRDVAIKVLPDLFAADLERLTRFQREAQVLASLNHANIAHIHGLEDSGAVRGLVMELVEGEDLAQRLARGPMPLHDALPVARQIAEALEAAHEQGIIHRDLKPANIKVRDDGTVKVLDFGLAKALDPAVSSSPQLTNSPTLSLQATQAGIILGTAAYMAPEQAHGRAADRRADIFSFGAVLFEMLAGTQAFAGESISDTLASVLKLDPDWQRLPEDTPSAIRTLLRRCLTKDRAQRLQSIGEARIVLAQPAREEPETTIGTRPPATLFRSAYPWVLATAVALIVAAIAMWGWLRPRPRETPQVVGFSHAASVANVVGAVTLSNDGSRLAFVGGPQRQIFVRSMDQLEATPISNTQDASALSFSPDGGSLSYIRGDPQSSESQLMKVALTGGPAQPLVNIKSPGVWATQHWMPDGNILFVHDGALLKISANGGKPETLATPEAADKESSYQSPQVLPGGTEVLATITTGATQFSNRVVALNLETRRKKVVIERFGIAHFVPSGPGSLSGHLVSYDVGSGSLRAAPFDVKRLEVTAAPVTLVERIRGITGYQGSFAISGSGTLAYVPGGSLFSSTRQIVWVDRQGGEQLIPAPLYQYNLPRLSPDGERIAIEIQTEGPQIGVYDLARGVLDRITTEGSNSAPMWTPDGKRVIYRSSADPGKGGVLMSVPVDRSGPPSTLTSEATALVPSSVSPDGGIVIGYTGGPPNVANEIAVVSLSAGAAGKPRTLLAPPFRKANVSFSPDGAWVAYESNQSGRGLEVYVTAYPGPGSTVQISSDGGTHPRWSRDGRQLFYRNGARMMAVDVQLTPTFLPGRPEVLFEKDYLSYYDVAPDGKRFLMVKSAPVPSSTPSQPDQLNIVVHWVEELKARVPAK